MAEILKRAAVIFSPKMNRVSSVLVTEKIKKIKIGNKVDLLIKYSEQ